MTILIQKPDLGLNALVSDNMLDPRAAALSSSNILYDRGVLKTAYGFANLNLTSGLNSSAPVLSIFPYNELNGQSHLMATAGEKTYEYSMVNEDWTDRTGSATINSSLLKPISYVQIASTDTSPYYHLVWCDGGLSDIQRWAGGSEDSFTSLLGGGDYHDGTTHRALCIGKFQNRLILVSPYTYSSTTKQWTTNNQRVQWPVIANLETWTGTGSGFVDLNDTGGYNVFAGQVGGNYIIYQSNGIWTLRYVGGSAVFDPYPYIQNIGLLAPHLLVSYKSVNYFIGTDYNVYAYLGGTVIENIGAKITDALKDDMSETYENRCWMSIDEKGKRLWIFIVTGSNEYITKAYGVDILSGSWMVRDFTGKYTGSGITAVNLVGAQTYIIGESYKTSLDTLSTYDSDVSSTASGDTTIRYGDVLRGDTTENVLDWSTVADAGDDWDFTQAAWSTDGLFFCYTASSDPTEWWQGDVTSGRSNLILRIDDGSDSANVAYGTHYYTISDVSSTLDGADYTITVYLDSRDTDGKGIVDQTGNIPLINNVGADTSATLFCASGETYNDSYEEILTDEALHIGDATGYVYKFDQTLETDEGDVIVAEHITPTYDLQMPEYLKRWPGITIIAREK